MSVAKQRLYRTVDDKVVPEGHPDAAFLLAGVGDEIPEGFTAPKGTSGTSHSDADVDEVDEKAAAKPANKAVKASDNKGS